MIRGYLGELEWLDSIFRKFMDGSDVLSFYDSSVTYSKYDKIKDNFCVFESKIDNNIGNPTSNEDCWDKILDSFIGNTERVTYVCRQLPFEYALNHYFQQQILENGFIGWKQPDSLVGDDYSPKSDIYISQIIPENVSFAFSNNSVQQSGITSISLFNGITDITINSLATFYRYAINIPTDVYNSLGTTDDIRDSIIRNFVDKINVCGCGYEINVY